MINSLKGSMVVVLLILSFGFIAFSFLKTRKWFPKDNTVGFLWVYFLVTPIVLSVIPVIKVFIYILNLWYYIGCFVLIVFNTYMYNKTKEDLTKSLYFKYGLPIASVVFVLLTFQYRNSISLTLEITKNLFDTL